MCIRKSSTEEITAVKCPRAKLEDVHGRHSPRQWHFVLLVVVVVVVVLYPTPVLAIGVAGHYRFLTGIRGKPILIVHLNLSFPVGVIKVYPRLMGALEGQQKYLLPLESFVSCRAAHNTTEASVSSAVDAITFIISYRNY